MNKNKGKRIKSVETSFLILETLLDRNGCRVTELSEILSISPSTAHNHLSTLQHYGYVTTEGDEYHIGMPLARFGDFAQTRKDGYIKAIELSSRLAEATGLDSDFIIEENGRGIYVETQAEQSAADEYPKIGEKCYLHTTAAGKAILANLPEGHVEAIITRWGLPAQTRHSITNPNELHKELETIRAQGYALNISENTEAIRAIGAVLPNSYGITLGAVSVSGPEYRISDERLQSELPSQFIDIIENFWPYYERK